MAERRIRLAQGAAVRMSESEARAIEKHGAEVARLRREAEAARKAFAEAEERLAAKWEQVTADADPDRARAKKVLLDNAAWNAAKRAPTYEHFNAEGRAVRVTVPEDDR